MGPGKGARADRRAFTRARLPSALKTADQASPERFPAYTLVDLFAGYDWGRYSFELFATNVFDKRNQLSRVSSPAALRRPERRRGRADRSSTRRASCRDAADDRHPAGSEVLAIRAPARSVGFATRRARRAAALWLAMLLGAAGRSTARSTKRSTPGIGPRWRLRRACSPLFGEPTMLDRPPASSLPSGCGGRASRGCALVAAPRHPHRPRPQRSAEILDRAGPARARAASRRRQDQRPFRAATRPAR